jgi:Uncharacterized protein conserved in bacteria
MRRRLHSDDALLPRAELRGPLRKPKPDGLRAGCERQCRGVAIYSTRQLAERGIARDRISALVRSGELTRLRRGRYATAGADPMLVAAVAAGGRLSCVSALARAGAWTMPGHGVHVRVSAGAAVRAQSHVGLHRTRERLGDSRLVDELETAYGLAMACLDLRAAIVVTDSVLNRRLLTPVVVERTLQRTPRGRAILRRADASAESGIETLARLALRRRNLRVRTQVLIPPVGRVDLLIGDRLILETDGREWHSDFERDRARDRALTALGYIVLRASYRQVMHEWPLIEEQIAVLVRRREHLWRRTLPQGRRHPPSTGAAS